MSRPPLQIWIDEAASISEEQMQWLNDHIANGDPAAYRVWWDGEKMRREPISHADFYGEDPSNDPSNKGA